MTTSTSLELQSVTTGYGDIPVVRSTSMRFNDGVVTSVIGSNGAGKSTAIKAAVGLLKIWSGKVLSHGEDITEEPAHLRVHRGIAYVPQGRIVVPEMTVRDNLEIGAHILKGDRQKINAAIERVTQLFPVVGDRMKQLAGTMSGGEQQMLAISRALMTSPSTIVLDEPSLGLSPKYVDLVFERLLELRRQGLAVIMVEQKATRALAISDVGYVMHMGRVAYYGTADELQSNENVKRLFLGEVPGDIRFEDEEEEEADV